MLNFDEQEMLQRGETIYGLREQVEEIADKLHKEGISNIFLTASGGSVALMQPFEYLFSTKSQLPIYMLISAEFVLTGHKQLNDRSIAILFSKSGDTQETLAAARYLREKNVRTVGISAEPDAKLFDLVDYSVCYYDGRPQEMTLYFLFMRLLHLEGEFPDYKEFADELRYLPNALNKVRIQTDKKARAYAEKYQNDPYQIWIGSGDLWGITYSYSMCVLEESQWLRTKSVSSPEFFHGTIELIEPNVCVTLLKTEGETRILDERVEKFAKEYTNNFNVFDTADYELPGISEKFRPFLSAPIMWAALSRISVHMEQIRNHPLDTRRYYRVVQY